MVSGFFNVKIVTILLKLAMTNLNHGIHFQAVSGKKEGNLITSPLSANVILSMAALGAGGNTKTEMSQVLNFQAADDFIQTGYQSFIDNLNVRILIL